MEKSPEKIEYFFESKSFNISFAPVKKNRNTKTSSLSHVGFKSILLESQCVVSSDVAFIFTYYIKYAVDGL